MLECIRNSDEYIWYFPYYACALFLEAVLESLYVEIPGNARAWTTMLLTLPLHDGKEELCWLLLIPLNHVYEIVKSSKHRANRSRLIDYFSDNSSQAFFSFTIVHLSIRQERYIHVSRWIKRVLNFIPMSCKEFEHINTSINEWIDTW